MEGNVSKDKSFEERIGTPESTFKEWIRAMADKERLQKEPGWRAVRNGLKKGGLGERVRLLYKAYNITLSISRWMLVWRKSWLSADRQRFGF